MWGLGLRVWGFGVYGLGFGVQINQFRWLGLGFMFNQLDKVWLRA